MELCISSSLALVLKCGLLFLVAILISTAILMRAAVCSRHGMLHQRAFIFAPTLILLCSQPPAAVFAADKGSPQSASLNIAALLDLPLPPIQPTCTSLIFCPGHNQILQTVQLSRIFPDDKTFVDRPAKVPVDELIQSFNRLTLDRQNFTNTTLLDWVTAHFSAEGQDLAPANITDFNPELPFFDKVPDKSIRGWLKIVHSYWTRLARRSVINSECPDCESSQIALNHTFIVPGGRFRENYYWDTFWVLEGLLHSRIFSLARSTILNFLEEIERYGFIPNGARLYYLNRSQPPLFTQMLHLYVSTTNDTSLLLRALPLVEAELGWWHTHRRQSVKSPFTSKEREIYQYRVDNSAPRPEGYHIDFGVVWGDDEFTHHKPTINLPPEARGLLYSQLSSGAESGLDYSGARWAKEPRLNSVVNSPILRTLNIANILPVDLNSIMYKNYQALGELYHIAGESNNKVQYWTSRAKDLKEAILDLFWDESRLGFYDFNLTSNAQSQAWSPASYTPYWGGIYPDAMLKDEVTAQKALAGPTYLASRFNGSVPASLIPTGLQWDFPNVWPPHVYIVLQAYKNLPPSVSRGKFSTFVEQASKFDFLPENHLGMSEATLPKQPKLDGSGHVASDLPLGTLRNTGNVEREETQSWGQGMMEVIANRLIASAFCSWYATGGSLQEVLPQLSAEELNGDRSIGKSGRMFEKFNVTDVNAAGGGGEYSVQDGFGWTNGIILTLGDWLGEFLDQTPSCPSV